MNNDGQNNKIVTRFPPSPTGLFHVGGARTALFNYLFTKQNNGIMKFRLEDTDKERSKEEYSGDIVENLKWLGLNIDLGNVYKQSENGEKYKSYLKKIIESGSAYVSKEEVVEEGQRGEVIRFKNPNKKVKFTDLIRGDIEFDTTELGDFVIAKDLESPLYHLAVVVDDFEMGVTHIIRGEDGISNTPRQILIQEAIGAPRPVYAHLPLLLDEDRSKLSKRKSGILVSVSHYRENDYIPEAVINFLALLGWSPQARSGKNEGTENEILSMDDLIKLFDLTKVQKGGAIFNIKKLNWLNREYMKRMSEDEKYAHVVKFIPEKLKSNPDFENTLKKILHLIIDRINTFSDVKTLFENDLKYFFESPEYEKSLLKDPKYLAKVITILKDVDEKDFNSAGVKNSLWDFATEVGRGEVLWPMRAALSGKEKSPDPFVIAEILGKDETLKRLSYAIGE